ncbi:LysR family transcriptional regulator [Marivita hallyeonensis]|nr:LysR family transcriptional regulator [Marivita hallyeonensis]
MNETPPSLDDLALFASVAQSGSLSAASRATKTPLPTLSRRMAQLERQLDRTLFQRGPSGYALTAEGRALADELTGLEDTRRRVARWWAAETGPSVVRITTGFWTARAIAHGLNPDMSRDWRPHFVAATAALDLARREADIGVRNAPPEHPWLARKQLATVHFAFYGKPGVNGIVATPPNVRSQRWLHENHGTEITCLASDPRLCLDLALAGHGRLLLPTFAGDTIAALERMSDPVPDLTHEAWLVAHQDARHDPPIRAAIDEITSILRVG